MRQMHVAVGMLACLLAGCADSTPTQLAPTGPRNVSIQSKPTLAVVVSAPDNCVTKVEWDASGVTQVDHLLELDTGQGLGTPRVSVEKHAKTSTVNWNPDAFTNRTVTGRVRATLYDRKGNVLASTDWVDAGFTCTAS